MLYSRINNQNYQFFFIFIIVVFFFNNGGAQDLKLKNRSYVKVDLEINEKVPPLLYTNYRNFPRENKTSLIVNEDSTLIKDNLTMFFLWQKDGVFQLTGKEIKTPIPLLSSFLKRKYWFYKVFNANYFETLNHIRKANNCFECKEKINLTLKSQVKEKRDFDEQKEIDLSNCKFNLHLTGPNRQKRVYKVICVTYYKYIPALLSDSSDNIFFVQPEYIISNWSFSKHEIEEVNKNATDMYNFSRLMGIYSESLIFSDHFRGNDRIFPRDLANFRVPIIELDKTNWLKDNSFILNKSFDQTYKMNRLLNKSCSYAYTIKSKKNSSEVLGIIVIPYKMFFSSRFTIVSVDDTPWEDYKMNICNEVKHLK